VSRIDEIINTIEHIQPLPSTVLRLIDVINNPHSTMDEIIEPIRYDQVLTARMLQLCNSAYFGLSREIGALEDAMRYLGTVKVMQMVMAIHTSTLLSKEVEGYGLAPGMLWKHSVAVALASSVIAERTKPQNPGLTFTGGLLHDIGKVVLNEFVAQEFAEIDRLVREQQMSFDQAEQAVLGTTSMEIGARLAENWKLPEAIVRCIRYHRSPSVLEKPDPLVDTVYLADCVCMLCSVGLGSDGLYYRSDSRIMERYQLEQRDLEVICAQMLVELKRVQLLFDPKKSAHTKAVARA